MLTWAILIDILYHFIRKVYQVSRWPLLLVSINMIPQMPHPDLMALLEGLGYRATAPRKAIADLLEQKQDGFTAEAISGELPSVGRATVYRTIKLLLKAGAVCKLAMMDGAQLYSLCWVGHHHHHTVCVECGAVEEFRATSIERLINEISVNIPGEIVDHRLELFVNCGLCPATGGD